MGRLHRSPVALMALTVFIDLAGFGLVIPLLPFWAERLGANPFAVGTILTSYAGAQFLCAPILGSLSDRYGRRPVIIGSLLVQALAFALTARAGSLLALVAARFVGGIGASNIGSAQAVVADVTPEDRRARAMGLIGAAIGLGFVVGPALGGVLSIHGATLPFWVAMAVALVNAALVWRGLPETHPAMAHAVVPKDTVQPRYTSSCPTRNRPAKETTPPRGIAALRAIHGRTLRRPALARLIAINLLVTIAFTAMEAVFALFVQRAYGWHAQQTGYVFAYVGVLVVAMQGGLIGPLVKRWGERRVLVAGLCLLTAGLLLLPLGGTLAVLFAALALLSVGNGASSPTTATLISFVTPPSARGETLGLAQGLAGLGRVVGPLMAGGLFAAGGPGASFLTAGALAAAAVWLALLV